MKLTLATSILITALVAQGTAQQREGDATRQLTKLLDGMKAEQRKAITDWFAQTEKARDQQAKELRAQIESLQAENSKLRNRLKGEAQRTARRLEVLLNEVTALRASVRGSDRRATLAPEAVRKAVKAPPAGTDRSVAGLGSNDAGTRFSALDKLVRTEDPKIVKHVAPILLEDTDVFVRRLAAEGLGRIRSQSAVDALVSALNDPESIVRHASHSSLRRLTGQDIDFEPDADPATRTAGTDRWKKWWTKHRARF